MNKKRLLIFLVTLILIASLIFLLILYGPEEIIKKMGVKNSYIVIFLIAIFGGVSAFTATFFFATLATFYTGGLNIFLLIILGSVGLTIGDSVFYYVGKKGYEFSKGTNHSKKIESLERKLKRMSPKWIFTFIFLYAAISPFPKDILCFVLGFGRYPYIKSMTPMLLGNSVFNTLFLLLISLGFNIKIF